MVDGRDARRSALPTIRLPRPFGARPKRALSQEALRANRLGRLRNGRAARRVRESPRGWAMRHLVALRARQRCVTKRPLARLFGGADSGRGKPLPSHPRPHRRTSSVACARRSPVVLTSPTAIGADVEAVGQSCAARSGRAFWRGPRNRDVAPNGSTGAGDWRLRRPLLAIGSAFPRRIRVERGHRRLIRCAIAQAPTPRNSLPGPDRPKAVTSSMTSATRSVRTGRWLGFHAVAAVPRAAALGPRCSRGARAACLARWLPEASRVQVVLVQRGRSLRHDGARSVGTYAFDLAASYIATAVWRTRSCDSTPPETE